MTDIQRGNLLRRLLSQVSIGRVFQRGFVSDRLVVPKVGEMNRILIAYSPSEVIVQRRVTDRSF